MRYHRHEESMAKKPAGVSAGALSRTEKLFLEAHRYNWDEGLGRLKKILKDPACDLGTALLIYWRARPEFFRQWKTSKDGPPFQRQGHQLIESIERKIVSGEYREVIAYDPKSEIGLYADLKGSFVRDLPLVVYRPSGGAISADDLIHGRRGEGAFLAAAKVGDLERLRAQLAAGIDVDITDGGFTALHVAATSGRVDAVRLLLQAGADPKLKDALDGECSIHHAVSWPHASPGERAIRVIELLLEAGVKVDQKARWHRTPLHVAASVGRADVAAFLVSRGAKRDATDNHAATALHRAAERGHLDVVKLLVENGWSVNAVDDQQQNVLHYAVSFPGWNQIETIDRGPVLRFLLDKGADTDQRDKEGLRPKERVQASARSNYLGPLERDAILAAFGLGLVVPGQSD
jgi:ankyrin repeat protein